MDKNKQIFFPLATDATMFNLKTKKKTLQQAQNPQSNHGFFITVSTW